MDIEDALTHLDHKNNVKFHELYKICTIFFGDSHIHGSHHVFKTPWQGTPWLNIQKHGKMAKAYQVKDLREALEKLSKTLH